MLSDKVDHLSATSEGLQLPSAPAQQCGSCCYHCFAEHGMPPPGCGDLSLTLPSPLAISRPLRMGLVAAAAALCLAPAAAQPPRCAVHMPCTAMCFPLSPEPLRRACRRRISIMCVLTTAAALRAWLLAFCAHMLFCHLCLCHYMSFAPSWVVARCVPTLHHCRYH